MRTTFLSCLTFLWPYTVLPFQCVGAAGVSVCWEKTLFLSILLYGVRQTASPLSHGPVLKEPDQTVRWLTAADIYQPSATFLASSIQGKAKVLSIPQASNSAKWLCAVFQAYLLHLNCAWMSYILHLKLHSPLLSIDKCIYYLQKQFCTLHPLINLFTSFFWAAFQC